MYTEFYWENIIGNVFGRLRMILEIKLKWFLGHKCENWKWMKEAEDCDRIFCGFQQNPLANATVSFRTIIYSFLAALIPLVIIQGHYVYFIRQLSPVASLRLA